MSTLKFFAKEITLVSNLCILSVLVLSVACWLSGNFLAGAALNMMAVNLMVWTK
jgi:hypothetical protein